MRSFVLGITSLLYQATQKCSSAVRVKNGVKHFKLCSCIKIMSGPLLHMWPQYRYRASCTILLSSNLCDNTSSYRHSTTVYPSSDGYFQQDSTMSLSSNHLRLVSWTWQWVHFTQMASTVTRPQSNRVPLGCGGMEDLHYGCAADKSAATSGMLSCQYGSKSRRNFSNTLLNLCHEELRQFWRKKWGSNPILASVSNKVASELYVTSQKMCFRVSWPLKNLG